MEANQIMVKMVLDRWYSLLKVFDTILDSVSDERMQKEVAPGKNRGIYLFGHLIAVHDDMMPILNFGEKLFPELEEPFIKFRIKQLVRFLPQVNCVPCGKSKMKF